jgi:hypothetical protein
MFQLLFERQHNVLMSRYSGVYRAEDSTLRDSAVRRFVKKHGLAHGIMDFSAVHQIEISLDSLIRRAHQPPLLPGRQRIIVAPEEPTFTFSRLVAAHQLYARKVEPVLVRSLRDAYSILGMARPVFEALPPDPVTLRERTLAKVLRQLNDMLPPAVDTLDGALASKALRLFDVAMGGARSKFITVSDILAVALNRQQLKDFDISAVCRGCGVTTTLDRCRTAAESTTRYSCDVCSALIVKLVFDPNGDDGTPDGYTIPPFVVCPEVDLIIAGITLPRTGKHITPQ